MLRKKSLRKFTPVTRKYARLLGEMESVHRRLGNMMDEIHRLERDSLSLANQNKAAARGAPGHVPEIFPEDGHGQES